MPWGSLEDSFPPNISSAEADRTREKGRERNPGSTRIGHSHHQRAHYAAIASASHEPEGQKISPRKPRASDLFHAREKGQQLVEVGGQLGLATANTMDTLARRSPQKEEAVHREQEARRQQSMLEDLAERRYQICSFWGSTLSSLHFFVSVH